MKGWGANIGRDLRVQKASLLEEIRDPDLRADITGISAEEWMHRYNLEDSLMEIYSKEEEFWRQRGSINWVLFGDANTAYFQAIANGRRRRCSIPLLWEGGQLFQDPQAIRLLVDDFYKSLFQGRQRNGVALADHIWSRDQQISPEENATLLAPFDAAEVETFVKAMNPMSAPGPDGLPVRFFQAFWPMVKDIILDLFSEFSRGTLDMSRLNYGIISLIPKVPGAADIRQFRPITVLNVIFRILAKGYATRAALIAPRIHHPNQSAFTKGRYILDGILALHEIIHEVKSKHLRAVFFKIDFHKAYDTVHWSFLREVLLKRGFDPHWVARVMQLVTSGRTAVNINGEVGPYFMTGQGVRQGDPISPFLFNLVVDALASILDLAKRAGHIRGICPHLVTPGGLTHLQYADDTIMMVEGSDEDIQNLKFLLLCFQEMSGLKINFHKSEAFATGGDLESQLRAAHMMNCELGSIPIKYLGMPISERG